MRNGNVIIRAEGLSKAYLIGHKARGGVGRESFRDMASRNFRGLMSSISQMAKGRPIVQGDAFEELWALRDVSFEVCRGEVMGIVGRNGAGKSTLLKVLSRITEPTRGRVEIHGRVASLLEVGTGFHPELTGRENIFLNGAILGMSRAEIRSKLDEIVAFAEVERFLDTPVKRYSSGMYVRLAFAVAAHLEPEVLIVDEVLAVGDAEFQRRCLGKMKEVATGQGRTVLFVSHNMAAVQQLCSSGMFLSEGRVARHGTIDEALASYMDAISILARKGLASRVDREGDGRIRIHDVTFHDERGAPTLGAVCGQPLRVRLHYRSSFCGDERAVNAAFTMRNATGVLLTCFANVQAGAARMRLYEQGYFECYWPKVNLRSGTYSSTVFVSVDGETCDWLRDAFQMEVEDGNFFGTGTLVPRDHGDFVVDQTWLSCCSKSDSQGGPP